MTEVEKAYKNIKKGIVINIAYIIIFIIIAVVVRNKWPEDWYYWIPVVLAIGSGLTIGTLIMNRRMLNRVSRHSADEHGE